MRVLIGLVALMMASPAFAAPAGGVRGQAAGGGTKEIMAEQIRSRGPVALIGKPCGLLKGAPLWGGLRPLGQGQAAELAGKGMKLNCGPGDRVDRAVLSAGFKGRMPKGTTWEMKQKNVYKTLKKAGLKTRTVKGADSKGAYVKLKGDKAIVWRWDDPKGKTSVDRIVIR